MLVPHTLTVGTTSRWGDHWITLSLVAVSDGRMVTPVFYFLLARNPFLYLLTFTVCLGGVFLQAAFRWVLFLLHSVRIFELENLSHVYSRLLWRSNISNELVLSFLGFQARVMGSPSFSLRQNPERQRWAEVPFSLNRTVSPWARTGRPQHCLLGRCDFCPSYCSVLLCFPLIFHCKLLSNHPQEMGFLLLFSSCFSMVKISKSFPQSGILDLPQSLLRILCQNFTYSSWNLNSLWFPASQTLAFLWFFFSWPLENIRMNPGFLDCTKKWVTGQIWPVDSHLPIWLSRFLAFSFSQLLY